MQEHTCRFTVAGTYRGGDGKTIYCPFRVCEQIYAALNEPLYVQSIRATLVSNNLLEELREASKKWFAEPNPLGKETPWGELGYVHYPYALDIHDDLLVRASAIQGLFRPPPQPPPDYPDFIKHTLNALVERETIREQWYEIWGRNKTSEENK